MADFGGDIDAFRADAKAWREANFPASLKGKSAMAYIEDESPDDADIKAWTKAMGDKGWGVPTWPTQYGGGGLSQAEARVLQNEMNRIGAWNPVGGMGTMMFGPTLLEYGNEEQKQKHIRAIAKQEVRWCQGFSEPGAGSDLASLSTKAEDKGDHFLVNGQKIWTSGGQWADMCFCLVRTDPQAVKQKGISFLLIDMATPGVSTRPIVLISGKSPFCETFFDNVAVPKENLVGALNRGWDVAKYLLTHEREMIAGGGSLFDIHALDREAAAQAKGAKLTNPILRAEIARTAVDTYASEATRQRYLAEAAGGGEIGARSALLKYDGTELNKRRYELLMSLAGAEGLYFDGNLGPAQDVARGWLRSKGNSIEGGTSEIMLDIVAKRLLELPAD